MDETMTQWLCARRLAAGLSAVCLWSTPGANAADQYLFDVLKNKTYLSSWNTLIASQPDAPDWLKAYGKTKNGPATPAEPVTAGGKTYEVGMVCKTHACGGNRFFVTFVDRGRKAYGLLLQGEQRSFYGSPEPEVSEALKKAANLP